MDMKVGYARVNTVGQKLDVQMDHLANCDRVFERKPQPVQPKIGPN